MSGRLLKGANALLELLEGGEWHWGRDLRAALAEKGYRKSVTAFYKMMAELEDMGDVVSERFEVEVPIDGGEGAYLCREMRYRHYTIRGD